jgi:hypothetical protein
VTKVADAVILTPEQVERIARNPGALAAYRPGVSGLENLAASHEALRAERDRLREEKAKLLGRINEAVILIDKYGLDAATPKSLTAILWPEGG